VYCSIDDGRLGCNQNHRKTWQWLSTREADWLVVVEDDAVPVKDFTHQLEQALTAAPSPIVGLYLGDGFPPQWQTRIRQAVAQADTTGACWITGELLFGVGIAIKADLVEDMLTYTDHTTQGFDFAIKDWAKTRGHTIAFTYPSLLDHQDETSIAKHPDGGTRTIPRKAHKTGGRGTWTHRTVTM
jgi:GR25 family glycosyltransferase involved in LPS biosynthesis